MGKNTVSNRKKKLAKLRKKNAAKLNLESLTTAELLARAQEQIDSFQFETAQKLCQEALKRDPDNVSVLETSSCLCIETGNLDSARQCLGRAITLMPEEGHRKYMSMAQLLQGKESLQCYLKGIEILLRLKGNSQPAAKESEGASAEIDTSNKADAEMTSENSCDGSPSSPPTGEAKDIENEPPQASSSAKYQDSTPTIDRQVSTAYCSVAELFMTDLCDDEDAEEQCRASIDKAIQIDPVNPEAYQLMASFLLVKQEVEEAKTFITKSIEIWLPKLKEVDEGTAAAGSFDPVEVCPLPYPTRLSTARILIEVEDYKHAMEVLEGLAEEDDEIVDTWYLMGWTCYLQREEQRQMASYYIHRALQVHSSTPCGDEQLVEHLHELSQELGPYVEAETVDDAGIEEELQEDSDDENNADMDTT